MIIGGLVNLTLLDYPDKVACTVFTAGCNFRCPFCHNNSLVCGNGGRRIMESEVLAFLKKRRGVLEGMCLTGGEPLMQGGVEEFLRRVKDLGYSVKLDTNGAFPDRLRAIIEAGLVDYVAMDVKNSRERYAETAGCAVDIGAIERSVELLKGGIVDYEFRTTVTGNLHNEQSIEELARWLAGDSRYYLQQFVDSGDLIDGTTVGCGEDTMKRYLEIVRKYVPSAQLRGI